MSSRESDSAFPPPRRSGPDAYPSGTPPYGTGLPAGFGAEPAAEPDDVPKTETTLTTRVRINIPGSRPIPPVVVRSPVKDEKPAAEPAEPQGPRHRGGNDPVRGVMDPTPRTTTPPNLPPEWQEPAPAPAASEAESTGEWFKPRQKAGSAAQVPAGAPAGGPAPAPAPGRPAPAAQGEPRRPAAPRPTGAPASPFAPAAAEAPAGRPGQGGRVERPAGDPYAGSPHQDQLREPFHDPFAAAPSPAADPFAAGRPAAGRPAPGRPVAGRPTPGADPFADADPFATTRPGLAGASRPAPVEEPEDTQIGGFDPIEDEPRQGPGIPGGPNGRPFESAPPAAGSADPFGTRPAADPFGAGQSFQRPAASPAADPFASRPPGGGRFADAPEPAQPFPGSPRAAAPKGAEPAAAETQAAPAAAPASAAPAKKKSGKAGKLAGYAVGGLLFAGAAAYGTGLMLNQADIPKGTTVLGTDIGGDTRDQAVTALDGSVAKTGQQPLKLKIGDKAVDLDPASAGLSFDTTATVDGLTKHSWNPVEVIGSLAGGGKAVEPQVRIDKSKLKAALDDLAGKSGQGLQEGYVRFTDAGPEVVPGKAGQAVDSASAVAQVEQAYRNRAAGRPDGDVALPLAAAQPKVGQDALQAAADSLGKQVLAGNIQVYVGTVKKFEFGKATAAKALTLAPDASGKLVPKWDLDKLAAAYGTSFDKLKFKKGGQSVPITAQDVADGIASAFEKTGKDRAFRFTA
ncbi:peptidoglycan binding domain-containing protein [Kitasatospora sp. NPDC048365]|uniref:peptidoglycan binding domain-containing protein n=1 Tax=Kitasatospora sp. NPDC048365 TaxID=3364050 RepID=UPI00371A3168